MVKKKAGKQQDGPVVWKRQYGAYTVRVCFAPQDVPDAEKRVLDAVMQAYRARISREMG